MRGCCRRRGRAQLAQRSAEASPRLPRAPARLGGGLGGRRCRNEAILAQVPCGSSLRSHRRCVRPLWQACCASSRSCAAAAQGRLCLSTWRPWSGSEKRNGGVARAGILPSRFLRPARRALKPAAAVGLRHALHDASPRLGTRPAGTHNGRQTGWLNEAPRPSCESSETRKKAQPQRRAASREPRGENRQPRTENRVP